MVDNYFILLYSSQTFLFVLPFGYDMLMDLALFYRSDAVSLLLDIYDGMDKLRYGIFPSSINLDHKFHIDSFLYPGENNYMI